jgi:hypothetical protein
VLKKNIIIAKQNNITNKYNSFGFFFSRIKTYITSVTATINMVTINISKFIYVDESEKEVRSNVPVDIKLLKKAKILLD